MKSEKLTWARAEEFSAEEYLIRGEERWLSYDAACLLASLTSNI